MAVVIFFRAPGNTDNLIEGYEQTYAAASPQPPRALLRPDR